MRKARVWLRFVCHLATGTMALATIFSFAGGCAAVSAAQTFGGIGSAKALSPTTVKVTWNVAQGYISYEIYSSASPMPVGSTKFGYYSVQGLSPNTSYQFSVAGVLNDGSRHGGHKIITVRTWPQFSGITGLAAPSATTLAASWSYPNRGTTFKVYVNPHQTPTDFSAPAATTKAKGASITKLANGTAIQANTTYYVIVRATYPDGTQERNRTLRSVTTPPR